MIAAAARPTRTASPSRSPTCATGPPRRASRSTCWSPTPPCSGCPATSSCCPALVGRVRARRLVRLPGARQLRRAQPHDPRRAGRRGAVRRAHPRRRACPRSHDPATYLDALAGLGCTVDAWETTYLHVLTGEDPVFTWVSGTGARPTLQALPDDLRAGFEEEFKRAAARGVPAARRTGVVLPFRRIFVGRAAGRAAGTHEAPPRPGRLPARRRGRRPPLLRRRASGMTEVEKPADLAGRGGAWFRCVRRRGRRRRRAARRRRGAVRAGPQGAPGVRRRRPARWRRRGPAARPGFEVDWSQRRHASPATCGSTPSTRTATGSRCWPPVDGAAQGAERRACSRSRAAPR